jgi:NAD/NADP transhydrogenase alpha subunit
MYAKNVTAFLANLLADGELVLSAEDDIVRETLVIRNGEILRRVKS